MTVSVQQIQMGVVNFVEKEIAQKAVGLQKFAVYFMLPKISQNLISAIDKYRSNPMIHDLFDENGNAKIDEIYSMAKDAVQKSGQFEYAGIIFNETDIDKLYQYIVGV